MPYGGGDQSFRPSAQGRWSGGCGNLFVVANHLSPGTRPVGQRRACAAECRDCRPLRLRDGPIAACPTSCTRGRDPAPPPANSRAAHSPCRFQCMNGLIFCPLTSPMALSFCPLPVTVSKPIGTGKNGPVAVWVFRSHDLHHFPGLVPHPDVVVLPSGIAPVLASPPINGRHLWVRLPDSVEPPNEFLFVGFASPWGPL